MKNHIIVNGQILQTNKKRSHIKQGQKNSITGWLKVEYYQFIEVYLQKPKRYKEII
ncbi:hypothetical protein [Bacillus thuringiensis]|uniref:hypothetical protein n=1 Tax=Bacillus thuringiensis TaxID=1428 RepID=UPI0026E2C996|nr:hypothetical protein [Bacillus thuringiensis]MDO6632368.1 hypothetical protein [Bacillus thuringiensis]MDO6662298.1 hypothetical protein [Bacillus thuringiensis]MDO6703126.1 hypothetical protein [Bacillus thuringiensis]